MCVTKGPVPFLLKIAAPEPVTVHCAEGVRWFPSSRGNLNCFSALQKWLEVAQSTFVAPPPSIKTLPIHKPSTNVEQAPKIPKNGMFVSLKPKLVEIHWFKRSPAKQ